MAKKNPAQISLFPEPQYEYHILLSPPDAIKADVARMKEVLDGMIGIGIHNFTPAHLTLHTMEAAESVNIKELLKTALTGQRKLTVKIDGYETWNQALVLKIANPEPVAALAAIVKAPHKAPVKVERQTSILDKPKRTPKLAITPHITIARGLTEEDFSRIEDFTAFDYSSEWVCDRITILRRRADSNGRFTKYAEVKLK
jgi:2'-5' RNA ligase